MSTMCIETDLRIIALQGYTAFHFDIIIDRSVIVVQLWGMKFLKAAQDFF